MNRAPMTQTPDDVGHRLTEIADHVTCTRGCHCLLSLPVIDQQGQILFLIVKTDEAGMVVHDHSVVGELELALCPPMHPPRRWRRNLHRYVVRPYRPGSCARTSRQETRPGANYTGTYTAEKCAHPFSECVCLLLQGGLIRVRPGPT